MKPARQLRCLVLIFGVLGGLAAVRLYASAAQDVIANSAATMPSERDIHSLYATPLVDPRKPERCEYETEWANDDTALIATARRLWGSVAHLDPALERVRTGFRRTIDPNDKMASAFCTREEDDSYVASLLKDARRRTNWGVRVQRTRFSLPFFDQNYDGAMYTRTNEDVIYGQKEGYGISNQKKVATYTVVLKRIGENWKIVQLLDISYWPPPCSSSQLALSAGRARDVAYTIRNVGNAPCVTNGYPHASAEDKALRPLPVVFKSPYSLPMRIPVQPLWLAPGAEASGWLSGMQGAGRAAPNCVETAFFRLDFEKAVVVRTPFVHRLCAARGREISVAQTSMSLIPPPLASPSP